ncbi:hypothetical protein A3A95_01365 [Candidatus Nomurabacteria bacterium RIFCSPLOWO2_01_FULL_39_18]|uniref:HTH deoR-type domain-containing protein n=1 Tax=Candidatus Nomurabacteria bacterium RIFCSPHIGHO2_01_FULL_40_24b TaxID=1801739 RepID=A0A1F6V7U7_9BACT|nr:MAG: hypothetical protein A2647_00325 [Candidatus Nomurabacteria bacterium RIFCSPHIGHO2_01_FULL_40_24b]OGI88938.1 MAG: hypothetical protein A3A95_01365 [Candidatus Nomurabacteria bacterium RIFCSPLOWO2_01_FULL_39_18]
MLEEDRNIKDSSQDLFIKDRHFSIPYNKVNKLIMALYMVTDMIDKEEPLRNRLRTLGAEIISDVNSIPTQAIPKITEVMSLLDIASAINLISEMNFNILKKEFLSLEQSMKEYGQIKSTWLEEHFLDSDPSSGKKPDSKFIFPKSVGEQSKGHQKFPSTVQTSTRIGLQKGSTLMKALSDKTLARSLGGSINLARNNFDILKRQRREEIVHIIKMDANGLTITDIKKKAQGLPMQAESLISCSEKTIQRELISMVKEGILNKTGEKRWSRYFAS